MINFAGDCVDKLCWGTLMNSVGDRRNLTVVGGSNSLAVAGEGKNLLIVRRNRRRVS